ncbi:MAG: hypothetical protein B7Y41_05080 [Hydrogenophilales bacterium 28-61-23]|nr:MAG: hypothetical protein B7Y41_05080 [Hydrogenophilales bacterium 28-61-23]
MMRRTFLKRMLGSGLLLGAGFGLPGVARAAGSGKVLVVVFLRGGWDGLNVAVPYGEDAYHSLRPTIGIAAPSPGNADSALDLDGFFGFPPAMAPIHALYREGKVAVLPAVHYPSASRSHFEGQDIIEDALTTLADSGWLARYLAATSANGAGQRALSLTPGVPRSLRGTLPVAAYPDLGGLVLASTRTERDRLGAVIAAEYARAPVAGNSSAALLHNSGTQLLLEMDELLAINSLPVEGGAVYPATAFGRQMRQAAALVKGKPGLELITLNLDGWDTHRGQGGGQPTGQMALLLKQFSDSVAAFFQDLAAVGTQVTLLASSEFGRTAAENGSAGTDHGNATTWLAIGGGVRGGIYTGSGWPGLGPSQLQAGRYLAHSLDFRAVYGECLSKVLGVSNPGLVIPGYDQASVGFLV